MKSSIEDKIAFVTGGAKGIGKGIVTLLCKQGADVVFCDIDELSGKELCEELSPFKCAFLRADVSDADALTQAMEQVLEEKGRIDILINNAGVSRFGSLLAISIDEFDNVLATNLRSVFVTSKILAAHREANPALNTYGRIINMASTRYLMSEPDSEAYAASKGGVVSLTHALALSLSKYAITVNCISPGWIEIGDYQSLIQSDHEQHPSGRVGQTEDIARMCLYLCDPANDFINGQNIVIDGGMTKKMIYRD